MYIVLTTGNTVRTWELCFLFGAYDDRIQTVRFFHGETEAHLLSITVFWRGITGHFILRAALRIVSEHQLRKVHFNGIKRYALT